MNLQVTGVVAASLALLMLPLTMMVSMQRVTLGKAMGDVAGVAFGDGDDLTLRRRIRAFGNFVEYVPICLVLLAIIELSGATTNWLYVCGGALVAGRLFHATGMLFSPRPTLRIVGMTFTYIAIGGPAVWLMLKEFS